MANDSMINKALGLVGGGHPDLIPQALVTSKKALDTRSLDNKVNVDRLRETPALFSQNVGLFRNYPNTPLDIAKEGSDEDVLAHAKGQIKDNLLHIHDNVPPAIRERSAGWYAGAHEIVNGLSKAYGLPVSSTAGVMAALSPQKDWYQNVSLGKRLIHAVHEHVDKPFDGAMEKAFMERLPNHAGLADMIRGKSLNDIDGSDLPKDEKTVLKAIWVRMHDEVNNPREYRVISPEGEEQEIATSRLGPSSAAWGSLVEIGKAIRAVEEAGNTGETSKLMGEKHKVRNFNNNILDPASPHGDVTIDTHAVAAGLLRPLGGNDVEVAHNFGSYAGKGEPSAGGSALTGIQGTYPIHADAMREAAAERGLRPNQMQSITWEGARGLFPANQKRGMKAGAESIWNEHREGRISADEARRKITELGGGFRPPPWAGSGDGVTAKAGGGAVDQGELQKAPRAGVPEEEVGQPTHPELRTEAQIAAGNYKKHHTNFQGIPITIENQKGTTRRGRGWQVEVPYHYGYIKRTQGADGDHVDVCLGDSPRSNAVFIIDQNDLSTGKFDEHKVMLGYDSKEEALDHYRKGFSDGKGDQRIGAVVRMTVPELKGWLASGNTKKATRSQRAIDKALALTKGQ